MWPFRRKIMAEEISLSDLEGVVERSPAKMYVNLLMIDLADRHTNTCELSPHAPLPYSMMWTEPLPSFEEVRNRLKILAGLNPVHYASPISGRIELGVGGCAWVLHAEFDDTPDNPRIRLRMESSEPETLQELRASHRPRRYLEALLYELAAGDTVMYSLHGTQPLPRPAGWEEDLPEFNQVRAVLLARMRIDELTDPPPLNGHLELPLGTLGTARVRVQVNSPGEQPGISFFIDSTLNRHLPIRQRGS